MGNLLILPAMLTFKLLPYGKIKYYHRCAIGMLIQTSMSEVSGVRKQVKYSVSMSLLAIAFGIRLSIVKVDGMLKMNESDYLVG